MVFGFDYSLVNLLSLVVGLAFLANGLFGRANASRRSCS